MSMATDLPPDPPTVPDGVPAPEPLDERATDRRVLRRAVRAGAATFLILGVGLSLAFGGGARAAVVWWCSAFVVGALVTAGWMLLVMGLDMLAGHVPSRRRAVWTALAFVVAFVSPVLPAAALRVAGS